MAVSTFADAQAAVARGEDPLLVARALTATLTEDERLWCLDGDAPTWAGLTFLGRGGYHQAPFVAAQIGRVGLPGIAFADGPRGCVVGNATAFPVSMARGATWDPDLEEQVGDAIGRELRAVGASLTGAVCVNLLRHPAWGRAQETYGEEPLHVGEMGAALTRGLQRHVLACVKHLACNSMENARFSVDIEVDEVALHEVYLPHFRRIIDEGVASVMAAYNALNGEWCGQDRHLLTDVLRDEWGFAASSSATGSSACATRPVPSLPASTWRCRTGWCAPSTCETPSTGARPGGTTSTAAWNGWWPRCCASTPSCPRPLLPSRCSAAPSTARSPGPWRPARWCCCATSPSRTDRCCPSRRGPVWPSSAVWPTG